jgi:CDP-diacylglycerol--glycerol-3-phosphate 3-phosphatidyltransferase
MVSLKSLPNLLGLFRILATPVLAWLILQDKSEMYIWAVALLAVMALSDFIDGRLARHLKVVSPLGVFIDTISDKIFVAGALLPMIECNLIPSWVALVIIGREFIISGLRSYAASQGTVISAGSWGKQKFTITVVALAWLLLAASATTGGMTVAWGSGLVGSVLSLWVVVMGLAVFWTIMSGVDYVWKAWPLLRRGWTPASARPNTRPLDQ